MRSPHCLLSVLGLVEDRLVLGQETGGRVHRTGAQPAGVVLHEPGELVPDAQSQVGCTLPREFRDVLVHTGTQLSLRHTSTVTAVTGRGATIRATAQIRKAGRRRLVIFEALDE